MNQKVFVEGQVLQLWPCRESAEGMDYYKMRIYQVVCIEEVTFIRDAKSPGHALIMDNKGRTRLCNLDDLKVV